MDGSSLASLAGGLDSSEETEKKVKEIWERNQRDAERIDEVMGRPSKDDADVEAEGGWLLEYDYR